MNIQFLNPLYWKEYFYSKYNINKPFSPYILIDRSIKNMNVIFIHIPKAAGTSIVNQIYGSKVSHHSTAMEFMKYDKSRFNNCFKFSIIRDPYYRFISSYFYLKKGGRHGNDFIYKKIIDKFSSINDFVLNIEKDQLFLITHFKPQHYFIFDQNYNLLVDKVWNLASLKEASSFLHNKRIIDKPFKHLNSTSYDLPNLPSNIKKRIFELYENDYFLFNKHNWL